jgi:hypothetical protein
VSFANVGNFVRQRLLKIVESGFIVLFFAVRIPEVLKRLPEFCAVFPENLCSDCQRRLMCLDRFIKFFVPKIHVADIAIACCRVGMSVAQF